MFYLCVSGDGCNYLPFTWQRPVRELSKEKQMFKVPVVDAENKPLMPCRPARARTLVKEGKALSRWSNGVYYIRLFDRVGGDTQPIVVGADPGSKREGYSVISAKNTFLNIQADAICFIDKKVEMRKDLRKSRRKRKTPYRKCRYNRRVREGWLPPSTKARWDWKLRICKWLSKLYPITTFVVEDIRAITKKGQRRWNRSFSPLETGKNYFYKELKKITDIEIKQGYETSQMRTALGLTKTLNKLAEVFSTHCVDAWVLANSNVGGAPIPNNERLFIIKPFQFHRRQLHVMVPIKGGIRKKYGGTRSMGFKRGSLVKHKKWGVCFVGGTSNNRISLYSVKLNKRLTTLAYPADCIGLSYTSFRGYFK